MKNNLLHIQFALAALLVLAQNSHAASWYLMAADVNVISQPKAASSMVKGSMAGPVRFTARGDFASRSECESDRTGMVQDWLKHSVIARGGWSRFGFTSPNVFIQCISDSDPRLSQSGGTRTMDILLQVRKFRGH